MSFISLFMDVNAKSPQVAPDSTGAAAWTEICSPHKRVQNVLQTGMAAKFQLSFFQLLKG